MEWDHKEILAAEERLRAAMLASDVVALDELLSDGLIFTNHFGRVMGKRDDLAAHRSGAVKIKSIEQSEQQIKFRGDFAIVSVLSHIVGEIGGVEADMALRFTRVWQKTKDGCWQVVVAHSSVVSEN